MVSSWIYKIHQSLGFNLIKEIDMGTNTNELLDFDRTVMTLSELFSDELVGSLVEGAVD